MEGPTLSSNPEWIPAVGLAVAGLVGAALIVAWVVTGEATGAELGTSAVSQPRRTRQSGRRRRA